jgi:hypothetical protein
MQIIDVDAETQRVMPTQLRKVTAEAMCPKKLAADESQ